MSAQKRVADVFPLMLCVLTCVVGLLQQAEFAARCREVCAGA